MTQKSKTDFTLRLVAFLIDFSMIYGTAFVLFNLLQIFHIYLSTVRLTLIIAILYFPIITITFKASIGKILCGFVVESNSKRKYSISIFLREAVYKQLFYILTISLIMYFYELSWLSPYFEILFASILSLILFIIFLFSKKTWYDQLAKTTVEKKR